jgi:hypothetical protein
MGEMGESRGGKVRRWTDVPLQLALRFIISVLSNPSISTSLYPSAFVGCWWDLRRDSLFYYLCIILVLGVFQGLCGVWIITGSSQCLIFPIISS